MIDAVIVSCEHGGNHVPPRYRRFFQGRVARAALRSHRGYDLGALPLARQLAKRLDAPLIAATVSRLVVDLNRALDHPGVFSEFLDGLSPEARTALVRRYYRPHRQRVEETVTALIARDRTVLHLAVHSFVPVLGGKARRADIGILYDPRRTRERRLARRYRQELQRAIPQPPGRAYRVWLNYPYRGYTDGLTTTLRQRFPAQRYLGIEFEVMHSLLSGTRQRATIRAVGAATEATVTALER